MASNAQGEGSFIPAAYGQACSACFRAKCKCFFRAEGTTCERCHRLGKTCEPGTTNRKRKGATPHRQRRAPLVPDPSMGHQTSVLENKLDDLVSILRAQVEKQPQAGYQAHPQLTPLSTLETTPSSASNATDSHETVIYPQVLVDTDNSTVHILRPVSPASSNSEILNDVSIHQIAESVAEEQLSNFRQVFLPMFPFVHIPASLTARDLRLQKPFLWLTIMALSTKMVSLQFEMENTIWRIISQRIVVQHHADLDLLLGVICFASWSHYFKKDKPFMTMLAQLAVSLACELGIQGNIPPVNTKRRCGSPPREEQQPRRRTLTERRTMLAIFHLTSSTWAAYKKTEPIRWTPYLDTCLRALTVDGASLETPLDAILAAQVRCHLITNDLIMGSAQDERILSSSGPAHSPMLTTILLRQLSEIRQSLPAGIPSTDPIYFYFHNAELSIAESVLRRPSTGTNGTDLQRLRDLDTILTAIEQWFHIFDQIPTSNLIGIHVDNFTQFLHCIVVLYKLTTLEEPGWDLEEVKRRADVFQLLNITGQRIGEVPVTAGIVDADGPRSGLFFKAKHLWRSIKSLLMAELPSNMKSDDWPEPQTAAYGAEMDAGGGEEFDFGYYANLANEPWLSDIFTYDWMSEETFEMDPFGV